MLVCEVHRLRSTPTGEWPIQQCIDIPAPSSGRNADECIDRKLNTPYANDCCGRQSECQTGDQAHEF